MACSLSGWTNVGKLFVGPLGTNVSEILIGIRIGSFKKMHLKTSSAKWRLFCLGLNVLNSDPAEHQYLPDVSRLSGKFVEPE